MSTPAERVAEDSRSIRLAAESVVAIRQRVETDAAAAVWEALGNHKAHIERLQAEVNSLRSGVGTLNSTVLEMMRLIERLASTLAER